MAERKHWGEPEAATLRSVRAFRRHSQADCADALRELGATVGQGAVSGWETGKHVPHSEAITAIGLYCNPAVDLSATGTSDALSGGAKEFDRLIGSLTGEPALSDRQASFIDALIARLSMGPPFSNDDRRVAESVFRLLGLTDKREGAR